MKSAIEINHLPLYYFCLCTEKSLSGIENTECKIVRSMNTAWILTSPTSECSVYQHKTVVYEGALCM